MRAQLIPSPRCDHPHTIELPSCLVCAAPSAAVPPERSHMWQRNVWILALGMSVACLDVATAPTGHTPLASSQPVGEHLWVFHIAGRPYAAHIQLLAIGDGADAQGRRVFRSIASRAWDGTPTNDLAGVQATPDDSAASSWTLQGEGGKVLRLAYTVVGDTAEGTLTIADGTRYPA